MTTPTLENDRVRLSPLNLSNYKILESIAFEKDLIYYSPSDISSPEKLKAYVEKALQEHNAGKSIPFMVYDKHLDAFAGSTRFGLIDSVNKTLHIGWTWIGQRFQGSGLNLNMKFLMLKYAFETLNYEKVEFRIDERNQKSRRAVEKLGATLEGILRKDTIMKDGFRRSTCCYGILKEEWPSIKSERFNSL